MTVDTVSLGIQQASASAQGLSRGGTEQAASLEKIYASIEELSATSRRNADNASQTEEIATKSAIDARERGRP